MRDNAWIYAVMVIALIIVVYVAVYKGLENSEKKLLGKAGYRRTKSLFLTGRLVEAAKKRKNDRSYFAVATRNLGREWKYEYKPNPYLCEITYVPAEGKGEVVFLVPRQEDFTKDVLVFYKRMRRNEMNEALQRLIKSMP